MYKIFSFLLAFLCPLTVYGQEIAITVVYDNMSYAKNLATSWGFACFIKDAKKNILFDTGGDGKILLNNLKKLNIDPKTVDIVVLSHIHSDHTGGLLEFLRAVNDNVPVYVLDSFPEAFKQEIKELGGDVISMKHSLQITKNVYTTGELDNNPKEQSLILDTENGLVVITGCAHPGIVNIVKNAKAILPKDIYLIMGGFHLKDYTENRITKVIQELKDLGVKRVAPSHCTGKTAISRLKQAWGKNFYESGYGIQINIR